MARCGCSGTCSCRIQEGPGITVDGVGSGNDPYRLAVDGGDIAGNGLAWDSQTNTMRVRTSGSGLGFDGTGALINTGGGGDGGGNGGGSGTWPTVDNLAAKGSDVIGGLHGAGYMIKPATSRYSVEYGIQRGVDVLHIPVRFLHDGTPVVHVYETMGTDNLSWLSGDQHVQEQDIHRWNILPLEPGMWNPRQAWQPDVGADPRTASNWKRTDWHRFAPGAGWFGYLEPNQYGFTTLDDVLRMCAGWVCVVIELRWPARDVLGQGVFTHATPIERTERFLVQVERLIDKYRMGDSAVVASRETTIPGGASEISVFERFYNRGIACGQWYDENADAEASLPGSELCTWRFASFGVAPETIQGWVAAGDQVLIHPINRQWMRSEVNALGALGVLSGDPEYYAGPTSHPTMGGYRYRKHTGTFHYDTIDSGIIPPDDYDIRQCQQRRRGSHSVGDTYLWMGKEAAYPGGGNYFVLQGWMCPLPETGNYAIDVFIGWDVLPQSLGDLYMSVAFGVTHDYQFDETWTNRPLADDAGSGYVFNYGSNSWSSLVGWGGQAPESLSAPSQVTSFGAGLHRVVIGVNPKGIRVSQRSGTGPNPGFVKDLAVSTSTLARAHRGGYVFFGRAAPNSSQQNGLFGDPVYLPGQGTTYGPQ